LAIRIIVNDTSCLIDLRKGGLLTTALLLPYRFVVALPLIKAELHDFTTTDWDDLKARGLEVIDLDGIQVAHAMEFKSRYSGLSAYDCFSLVLTETMPDAVLLTGDQQLRKRAVSIGLDVHGILWVCEELDRHRKLAISEIADALERLLTDPLVFLPSAEVQKRIALLRDRLRKRP